MIGNNFNRKTTSNNQINNMKAELRVGNYVSLHGVPYKVDEIFDSGARLINGDNNYVPEYWYMKPITLTPEILEKEKWKIDKHNYWYNPNDPNTLIAVNFIQKAFFLRMEALDGKIELYHRLPIPFYIHAFQNLNYSLFGEELNITL